MTAGDPIRVVIAAGGTGGHLYPAVALARELQRRRADSEIAFVGTPRGLETKVLAHEGFPLVLIAAQPVMGVGLRGVRGILALLPGVWQSVRLLRHRRANLVISVGGYTSPALMLAAWLLRVPRIVLEPNAVPGMANRLLGPLAQTVFVAFDSAADQFRGRDVRVVGSPIREEFLQPIKEPDATAPADRPLLLVFGGSQGARAINEAMMEAAPRLGALAPRVRIMHQTGDADRSRVQAAYEAAGVEAQVVPFLYDMPRWLRAAALVVARSGAMTLAELTAVGRAAVLVPLPHAIHGHQLTNARVLEEAGAAVVIAQEELTGDRLASVIGTVLSDAGRLSEMTERSRRLGRVDSARVIVDRCIELVNRKRGQGQGHMGHG